MVSFNSRNWKAYSNKIPKYFSFYVIGEVEVPNPGVEPILKRKRSGINPEFLFLDLGPIF